MLAWNVVSTNIVPESSFPGAPQEEPSMTRTPPRRVTRRTFTLAAASAVTAASVSVPPGLSLTQDATPPVPAGATVIAGNLANPRHLAIAGDGTIFVTEAGTGGDGLLNRGYSGRLSRITPDGTAEVLVSRLVSYAEGFGAAGIALLDDALYVAVGGHAVDRGQEPLPEENTLDRVDPDTGEIAVVAAMGGYEIDNNPDRADVSTNLYGIAPRRDGSLLVTDAGANVLYRVDPRTGEFALLHVIPSLARLPGREAPAGERSRQAVPTSVVVDDEDLIHVGLLSQRWPEDGPSILAVTADGTFTPVLLGGSMIVSIAFGPDRRLYFSQLVDVLGGDSRIGSIRRVLEDQTSEPVIENLTQPHGIAFDSAGNLFVATNALLSTPDEAVGQLLRFDGVAAA